jgi:hypothetical protein
MAFQGRAMMAADRMESAESKRLISDSQREQNWKRWGPYLSERQWGTVREDYSESGDSWSYFPHDHARSRAYRWGEDGLLGISDRQCRICFGLCMWNGQDSILKERFFGLTGPEGNHGEDVKECYFYLDSTPTHSYLKALYKYPQTAFPYKDIVAQNNARDRSVPEYELLDTGIFDQNAYFDVFVEYAKATPDDILIRVRVHNRSKQSSPFHFLPNLWFRNTWSWGCDHEGCWPKPLAWQSVADGPVKIHHPTLEPFYFVADNGPAGERPEWLYTENETNEQAISGSNEKQVARKDAFHEYIVKGRRAALASVSRGTKLAPYYHIDIAPGESAEFRFRMYAESQTPQQPFGEAFAETFALRIQEADEFYANNFAVSDHGQSYSDDHRRIIRQANAGLLWSKQFYHYVVENWLEGDPHGPPVSEIRKSIRNSDWHHLFNRDVISMPDKWEYPWYAAWDLAFHMVPFARIDPEFAKSQLLLFLREWYMHPNGQIPAYEWALNDVNPPVHAWACWRVYRMSCDAGGERDKLFLARVFQKLLLNFTWWVNREDVRGNHLFAGGFLGLDNIGIFDRSKPLPTGGHLEQADGTAWMAFYCSSMLSIALELAQDNPAYGDMASKFFEHYITIAEATNCVGGAGLWHEEDGFYYDHVFVNGQSIPLKIRSLVGLIPLITVDVIHDHMIEKLFGFRKRMDWFLEHNKDLSSRMSYLETPPSSKNGGAGKRLLAVASQERLRRILKYLLDENEFLSDHGIRSLSKIHGERPYEFDVNGDQLRVHYVPGESDSYMFGGNSNWRGPIWFPVNFLIVEALRRYHDFYGDEFQIECPTGSANIMNLGQVADEIQRRLISIFEPGPDGMRPFQGSREKFSKDEHWRDLFLFHEYFHGDNGKGLGACHQTGWTALVSRMIEMMHR